MELKLNGIWKVKKIVMLKGVKKTEIQFPRMWNDYFEIKCVI